MNFQITLTWSKLVALIFQTLAFVLDFKFSTGGSVFMFTIPFSVFLITGKQFFDNRKDVKVVEKEIEVAKVEQK